MTARALIRDIPALTLTCEQASGLEADRARYLILRRTRSRIHVLRRRPRLTTSGASAESFVAVYPCYPGMGGGVRVVMDAIVYLNAHNEPLTREQGRSLFTPIEG